MLVDTKPSFKVAVRIGTAIAIGLLVSDCSGTTQASVNAIDCTDISGRKTVLNTTFKVKPDEIIDIQGVTQMSVHENNLTLLRPDGSVDKIVSNGDNSLVIYNSAIIGQIYTTTLSLDGSEINIQGSCGS